MNNPKVSIITVNYNNYKGLESTINSVLSQTYSNIEFIIIDGGSSDGSLEVISKFKHCISIAISESDAGIYDAMNKGISLSSGSWINFMNSGDVFYDEKTINNLFSKQLPPNISLIYGSQYKMGYVLPPYPEFFLKAGVIHACHQAMFFYKGISYDLSFSIYSDYDLVARLYNSNDTSFLYVNEVICEFEGGGVSSVTSKQKRIDKYKSVYNNFGLKGFFISLIYKILTTLGLK